MGWISDSLGVPHRIPSALASARVVGAAPVTLIVIFGAIYLRDKARGRLPGGADQRGVKLKLGPTYDGEDEARADCSRATRRLRAAR